MKMLTEILFYKSIPKPGLEKLFQKGRMSYNKSMIKDKKISDNIFCLLKNLEKGLRKNPDIIFAYVFGSYGKGETHPLSDVDIAIYLKENMDFFEKKLEILDKVIELLGTEEIDLIILNVAPGYMVREVINTGKLLFSKDENLRVEFILRKLKEYFETTYLRKISESCLLERIRNGKYGIATPY